MPQGTKTDALVESIREAFEGCPVPVKVQDNIPRPPNTGGPGWFSIDLVIPVVQAAGGILLASGILVGAKSAIRRLRVAFPGSLIRILSDRRPTVAYQAPTDETLDFALNNIPIDYSEEKSTTFVIKHWSRDGKWEVSVDRLSRKASSQMIANVSLTKPPPAVVRDRKAAKRHTLARHASSRVRATVDEIVGSVRRPVMRPAASLSEIDSAVQQLQRFGDSMKARADSAYIGEALATLFEMRQREATALMSRWAKETGIHEGVDLAAPLGSKVTAIHASVVVEVGIEGYGDQAVRLRERDVDVILGHLSRAVVRPGQRLRRGQLVGYVGEVGGISTGPHIHVEVRPRGGAYGTAIDPMAYLRSADRPKRQKPEKRAGR